MRCSALAQTRRTWAGVTPVSASSSSTARIATGRIGPNEPVVWSSKAIVTRAPGRTRSRMRGRPRGAASAAPTEPARSASGGRAVAASLDSLRVPGGKVAVRVPLA